MLLTKKYKLIIAYDGTNYHGWQQQIGLPSVTQTIQRTFERLFNRPAQLLGASRTDAGVHALGQVALLKTDVKVNPEIIVTALNNSLPSDIIIRSATLMPADFHPWYNVVQKTYYYHFFTERPLPFVARYGWYYRHAIDMHMLRQALALFVGMHNFKSFACAQDSRENMIRTVDNITVSYVKRFGVYRIQVRGQKFLRHMIRRMVGAAVHVASHKNLSVSLISDILKKENPHHILPNAPAHGLLLRSIHYNKEFLND